MVELSCIDSLQIVINMFSKSSAIIIFLSVSSNLEIGIFECLPDMCLLATVSILRELVEFGCDDDNHWLIVGWSLMSCIHCFSIHYN